MWASLVVAVTAAMITVSEIDLEWGASFKWDGGSVCWLWSRQFIYWLPVVSSVASEVSISKVSGGVPSEVVGFAYWLYGGGYSGMNDLQVAGGSGGSSSQPPSDGWCWLRREGFPGWRWGWPAWLDHITLLSPCFFTVKSQSMSCKSCAVMSLNCSNSSCYASRSYCCLYQLQLQDSAW